MMNLSKQKVKIATLCCFLAVMVWIGIICWMDYSIRREEPFGCFVNDRCGNRRNGFYNEKDQIWYLFLDPTDEISKLTIRYTGTVAESSSGTIHPYAGQIRNLQTLNGNELELKLADGSLQRIRIKQSDLPSVHVVLPGTTEELLHQDKDTIIKGASVYISDIHEENTLISSNNVTITGRGNSTWESYEKRGYVLEFGESEPVLSMNPGRKWVLLANASDDSMIRNYLTYQLVDQMDMPFAPSCAYADFWINGDYRGTYLICEKVEIGDNRLPLKNLGAALIEQDESVYPDGTYRVLRGEQYPFYNQLLDKYFALKETNQKNLSLNKKAIVAFNSRLDELMTYLKTTVPSQVSLEKLKSMIDVDSVLQYYLISEYTLNCEAYVSSFFWYQDGPDDVIHLGPIWDYDTCMGNDGGSYMDYYAQNHDLFVHMLAIPAVYIRACQLWDTYRPLFERMAQQTEETGEQIRVSAEMNYIRWDVLGKPTVKDHAKPFEATHEQAVEAVRLWLQKRASCFEPQQYSVINSVVVPQWNAMNIMYESNEPYGQLRFAVWSDADGQDDLFWYEAEQDELGIWRSRVNLKNHSGSGRYHIHAYAEGESTAAAGGWTLVETDPVESNGMWPGTIYADMPGENGVELSFMSEMQQERLCFAAWSEADGQDDLFWYEAEQDELGIWRSWMDLADHSGAGGYFIHVYGDSTETALAGTYVSLGAAGD